MADFMDESQSNLDPTSDDEKDDEELMDAQERLSLFPRAQSSCTIWMHRSAMHLRAV